jgi:hypothetical protein
LVGARLAGEKVPHGPAGTAKRLSGGFFDCVYHQEQISVESALDLLAGVAPSAGVLIGADGTNPTPNGLDVIVDVVARYRVDRLCHLGEQPEQSTTGRIFKPASTVNRAAGADFADLVPDNRLYFY